MIVFFNSICFIMKESPLDSAAFIPFGKVVKVGFPHFTTGCGSFSKNGGILKKTLQAASALICAENCFVSRFQEKSAVPPKKRNDFRNKVRPQDGGSNAPVYAELGLDCFGNPAIRRRFFTKCRRTVFFYITANQAPAVPPEPNVCIHPDVPAVIHE